MGLFDQFPYTNFHELNLDWLLKMVKELNNTVENFVALNTIKYADPIQWNITTQYEANTVVVDPQDGTAYISSKPVPAGVALNNTDYWSIIFTLDVISANKNITLRDDGSNILATFGSVADDWLLWNGTLYKVTQTINVNEAYVVGYNLTRYTIELFINDYVTSLSTLINNLDTMIGDLNNLTTTDKTSLVNAVNELKSNVDTLSNSVTAINTKLSDYITPDNFTGTDGAKVQAAIDSLELTGGTIILDRVYTLDQDILIKRRTTNPNHKEITIIGLGGVGGLDFDTHSIRGYDTNYRDYGGLRFINVKMTGSEKAFLTNNLIRINLESCDIWYFNYIFYGTDTDSCQSIYVNNCSIQHINTAVHYAQRQAWDVHYNCNRIELCDYVFDIGSAKVLTITNNLIEGKGITPAQGYKAILIRNTYEQLYITGNYFEANETTLDMSNCSNSKSDHAVIQGNAFWEKLDNVKCIILPTSVSNAHILLSHNMFNLSGTGSYAISVESTGHVLTGVEIIACNGSNYAIYDPDHQLQDLATYASGDTFTATASYTVSSATGFTLQRFGKICKLNGVITLGQSLSAGDELLKIDSLYNVPSKLIPFPIQILGSGGAITSNVRANVSSSGSVYVQGGLSNGDTLLIDASWICK